MTTPNEPDGQRTGSDPAGGPHGDRNSDDRPASNGEWSRAPGRPGASVADRPQGDAGTNGAAAAANGSSQGAPDPDAHRPSSGTGAGGKPPWQRVGSQLPPTGGPVQPNRPDQSPGTAQVPNAQPSSPAANPKPYRPLVTGTAAPKPPGQQIPAGQTADQQSAAQTARAPIAKLDAQGNVGQSGQGQANRGRNSLAGKVIDGPTRNIDRSDIPEDLPDLDAIHHPTTAPTAQAAPSSSAFRSVESVAPGPRGPLRAAVQLRRIDPWSTFKISSVLAIALFLIWMIAIGVLYVILDGMGVWDQVNSSFGTLVSSDTTTDTSFQITAGGVFGIAALIGAVYVVVFTALTTVGAFIYNMSADLVGGVEITLADRD
ncbi:DUF3566 domain-containing protein [Williamsia herbipolensis]|uniref:DUF3566 domain-containing protein n=1 Tax=Williamsia herbipolensis TaxID=1603258 RepID=UPI000696970F|nr:DUF3566 domain-containing protein [Williamsia herbipolensis]